MRVFHDFIHSGTASHPSDEAPTSHPGMASPVDEGFRTLVFYLPVCANGGKFSAKGDRKCARFPALATTPRKVFILCEGLLVPSDSLVFGLTAEIQSLRKNLA